MAHFPSFIDAMLYHAATEPGAPAVGTEAGILTFGELAAAIRCATARCHAAGLAPGSLVGLIISDPVWHICLIAALNRLGVASISATADESVLFAGWGVTAILHDGNRPAGYGGQCLHVAPDWFTTQPASAPPAPFVFAAADLCRVALSSGTTGAPKPVAMSPQIVWDRLTTFLLRGGFAASDRIYCGPQLNSNFGFSAAFAGLSHGKMVSFSANAEAAFPVMSYFKVDLAILTVYQLARLTELPQSRSGGLGGLREIQAGGSLVSDALLERTRACFTARVVNVYASTEAGTVATAPIELLGDLRNDGAVGFITPWASVETCDDEGRMLPQGCDGNLRIRSLGLAPDHQAGMTVVDSPDHILPGDFGRVTSDGMLVIGGRTTELINIGGNKIAPDRFEDIIRQCAGVRDAAVFTVDIKSALPQTWAAIVADRTVNIDDIVRRCAATPLIGAPTVIRLVPSIPRNSTGKILRDQLRRDLTRSNG